jgi:N-acetyl-anhydromuramyl-L-alanine amidase AmpD
MHGRRAALAATAAAVVVLPLLAVVGTVARAGAAGKPEPSRQQQFEQAATESGVPAAVLPARSLNGGALPATPGGWYGAVARYADTPSTRAAELFADEVYATIASGAARQTDGGPVSLAARPGIVPDRPATPRTSATADPRAECPSTVECDFIPAAYAQNDPADPQNYGNYDTAERARTGSPRIDRIVLHDTEIDYAGTIAVFTNPRRFASAHYVVRSADGHITQLVATKDVAWHARNWYVNMHSIGIEQEGVAIRGAEWFTEQQYQATARLVRHLAAKYRIPLDRQHILGHDDVPGTGPAQAGTQHWDPGPFFDWAHFMALLGRPLPAPRAQQGDARPGTVVTINPAFATNQQVVKDCEGSGAELPPQPANFVYLRTAPAPDAPLVSDPALHPDGAPGTLCGADWGDKVPAGAQLVVAGRSGDWTAVWWGGQRAWFLDRAPGGPVSAPARAARIVPRAGLDRVPVFGLAYPEAAAYPPEIPVQPLTQLPYAFTAGQSYTTAGLVCTDYYHAKTIDSSLPGDHTVVTGRERYYQIQLNHRIAYVRATDVDLVR